MPLRLNGVEIEDLRVNGVAADVARLNGTLVYERFSPTHFITIEEYYNSFGMGKAFGSITPSDVSALSLENNSGARIDFYITPYSPTYLIELPDGQTALVEGYGDKKSLPGFLTFFMANVGNTVGIRITQV